jgi:predicted lipase
MPFTGEVWVIGHSLGAALATLVAAAIPGSNLCTFASPRVGNSAFVKFSNATAKQSIRIANIRDIVPHVPPRPEYAHVGNVVLVDGGFTLDVHFAHSLQQSYGPALAKLPAEIETQVLS